MNLVAKEYVASQPADDPGVLILSCFAGAARELGGAVIVNPFDIEGIAEAILLGLNMPLGERKVGCHDEGPRAQRHNGVA
jgi:trehalose 6-phosphate synthase